MMGTNVPCSVFVIAIIYAGISFLNHDAGTQAILNFALTHFRFHLTVNGIVRYLNVHLTTNNDCTIMQVSLLFVGKNRLLFVLFQSDICSLIVHRGT